MSRALAAVMSRREAKLDRAARKQMAEAQIRAAIARQKDAQKNAFIRQAFGLLGNVASGVVSDYMPTAIAKRAALEQRQKLAADQEKRSKDMHTMALIRHKAAMDPDAYKNAITAEMGRGFTGGEIGSGGSEAIPAQAEQSPTTPPPHWPSSVQRYVKDFGETGRLGLGDKEPMPPPEVSRQAIINVAAGPRAAEPSRRGAAEIDTRRGQRTREKVGKATGPTLFGKTIEENVRDLTRADAAKLERKQAREDKLTKEGRKFQVERDVFAAKGSKSNVLRRKGRLRETPVGEGDTHSDWINSKKTHRFSKNKSRSSLFRNLTPEEDLRKKEFLKKWRTNPLLREMNQHRGYASKNGLMYDYVFQNKSWEINSADAKRVIQGDASRKFLLQQRIKQHAKDVGVAKAELSAAEKELKAALSGKTDTTYTVGSGGKKSVSARTTSFSKEHIDELKAKVKAKSDALKKTKERTYSRPKKERRSEEKSLYQQGADFLTGLGRKFVASSTAAKIVELRKKVDRENPNMSKRQRAVEVTRQLNAWKAGR